MAGTAMNIPGVFVSRPIATTLLTAGVALAGIVAFFLLPVAPLPNTDFPAISVTATMPGASPETMATSVATPLERHLGSIADVNEMTSQSSAGSTRISLQFNIDRDIDGAARDVQAAINAARVDLPASLRSNPTYRKANLADAPIMILALTSNTLSGGQIYDAASTTLQQMLSQIPGVGDVTVGGSSLPAVRVDLNPQALSAYGIGLEDVRAALSAANADSPKGMVQDKDQRYQLYVNDTAGAAKDYQDVIVAYRNGAAVHVKDIATVSDGVENIRNLGLANGQTAILLIITKQPGANVIKTVDAVKAMIPAMQAAIPPTIRLQTVIDTTTTIRASVRDVERTLVIATFLVLLVVFFFLRTFRASLIPAVAVPLSIIGTFAVMYMLGFSLDNFSLMALTISTGFVIDDAIVVLENVTRHIEAGMPRLKAAMLGANEVAFTVLAMSVSLIAVFLPILLMGGLVGRLFHEFAVTLSTAIVVSLVISLTTTPMMCAFLSTTADERKENAVMRSARRFFEEMQEFYAWSLRTALKHPLLTIVVLAATIFLNFYLFATVSKGFFPQEDSGTMFGNIRADQAISYQAMVRKFTQFVTIIRADPAVQNVVGFTGGGGGGGRGGGSTNSGQVFVQLKPIAERKQTTDQVISRLGNKLKHVPGARLFLAGRQDVRAGARSSNSQYQYTIEADTLDELNQWVPKITAALQDVPQLEDVNSDQQNGGLEADLVIDRATAARLGLDLTNIDNTLYDAFGQRQVSTIYNELNQYHVVMEVAPQFWQSPDTLKNIYVSTSGGALKGTQQSGAIAGTTVLKNSAAPSASQIASDAQRNAQLNAIANSARGGVSTGAAVSTSAETMIPLSNVASYAIGTTPLSISHQGPFVATTFSFNLPPGTTLGDAVNAINRTMADIHVPISVHGEFAGTAQIFQQSLSQEPLLILAAIVTVYIVLGILYESLVHPITILSTLPSAGVGALTAIWYLRTEFSLVSLIGVILLIGIVKKNAIMMIDFALVAERDEGLAPIDAIYRASILRFRPIMMTTFAALFGALPLAVATGEGAELRQPLGIAIVGGLAVSQILTLYTTPVVYLYLERFRQWTKRGWDNWYGRLVGDVVG